MFLAGVCVLAAVAMMGGQTLSAQSGELKVGDKAPAFQGTDDQGKPFKSSDVVGKKIVVVYFYPADFTGGCTAQACGFRDDSKALTDKNIEVIGVSGDGVKTHAAFKKEHNLPFTLLSDPDGALAAKFGVKFNKKQGTVKSKLGETFVREGAAARYTTVIGMDGKVIARYAVSDAGGDSKKVLEVVQKMQK